MSTITSVSQNYLGGLNTYCNHGTLCALVSLMIFDFLTEKGKYYYSNRHVCPAGKSACHTRPEDRSTEVITVMALSDATNASYFCNGTESNARVAARYCEQDHIILDSRQS